MKIIIRNSICIRTKWINSLVQNIFATIANFSDSWNYSHFKLELKRNRRLLPSINTIHRSLKLYHSSVSYEMPSKFLNTKKNLVLSNSDGGESSSLKKLAEISCTRPPAITERTIFGCNTFHSSAPRGVTFFARSNRIAEIDKRLEDCNVAFPAPRCIRRPD